MAETERLANFPQIQRILSERQWRLCIQNENFKHLHIITLLGGQFYCCQQQIADCKIKLFQNGTFKMDDRGDL